MVEFKKETIEKIKKLPSLSEKKVDVEKVPTVGYINSRQVTSIKNVPIFVEDIVKASLISRMNSYYIGSPGCGKTQLAYAVASKYYNNDVIEARGSDWESDIKAQFTDINLKALNDKSVEKASELTVLTSKVQSMFAVIDEINRCPPQVQGRFFQLADGALVLDNGKKVELGGEGRLHFIATGNKDPEKQQGIFQVDGALLERCQIIINLDDFPVLPEDTISILMNGDLDPRIARLAPEDHRKEILSIASDLKEVFRSPLSAEMVIMSTYLRHGLDYCGKSPTKTKRTIIDAVPRVCTDNNGCNRKGAGCGYIIGASDRITKAVTRLTIALQAVAVAKDPKAAKEETDVNDILESFELIGSYQNMINKQWVVQDHYGNPHLAMNVVTEKLKQDVAKLKQDMVAAIAAYKAGKLTEKHLKPFKEEWEVVMKAVLR